MWNARLRSQFNVKCTTQSTTWCEIRDSGHHSFELIQTQATRPPLNVNTRLYCEMHSELSVPVRYWDREILKPWDTETVRYWTVRYWDREILGPWDTGSVRYCLSLRSWLEILAVREILSWDPAFGKVEIFYRKVEILAFWDPGEILKSWDIGRISRRMETW